MILDILIALAESLFIVLCGVVVFMALLAAWLERPLARDMWKKFKERQHDAQ